MSKNAPNFVHLDNGTLIGLARETYPDRDFEYLAEVLADRLEKALEDLDNKDDELRRVERELDDTQSENEDLEDEVAELKDRIEEMGSGD